MNSSNLGVVEVTVVMMMMMMEEEEECWCRAVTSWAAVACTSARARSDFFCCRINCRLHAFSSCARESMRSQYMRRMLQYCIERRLRPHALCNALLHE